MKSLFSVFSLLKQKRCAQKFRTLKLPALEFRTYNGNEKFLSLGLVWEAFFEYSYLNFKDVEYHQDKQISVPSTLGISR